MSYTEKLDTITAHGRRFDAHAVGDDRHDAPWENMTPLATPERAYRGRRQDSRGWVTSKRAGEMLISDRERWGYVWVYDFAGAVRQARKDGCDGPTADKAARAEAEYFRRWLAGDWHYIGVVVTPAGEGPDADESESLWGIESDADSYIRKVAAELAGTLALRMMESDFTHGNVPA